jgi:hypothetical protein
MIEDDSLNLLIKKWLEIARYNPELKFESEVEEDLISFKQQIESLVENVSETKKKIIRKDDLKFESMRIDSYMNLMNSKDKKDE